MVQCSYASLPHTIVQQAISYPETKVVCALANSFTVAYISNRRASETQIYIIVNCSISHALPRLKSSRNFTVNITAFNYTISITTISPDKSKEDHGAFAITRHHCPSSHFHHFVPSSCFCEELWVYLHHLEEKLRHCTQ